MINFPWCLNVVLVFWNLWINIVLMYHWSWYQGIVSIIFVVLVQFCLNSFPVLVRFGSRGCQHVISFIGLICYNFLFCVCNCSFSFFICRMQKMQLCIWEVSGWVVVRSELTGPHVNHLHLKVHKKVRYVYCILLKLWLRHKVMK